MSARMAQAGCPRNRNSAAAPLASPWRRRLLGLLRDAPAATGALGHQAAELSRFAVIQHLGVLADAGVVAHPAPRPGPRQPPQLLVPLREWYERWVRPMADTGAASLRVAQAGRRDRRVRHCPSPPIRSAPSGAGVRARTASRPAPSARVAGHDPAVDGLVPGYLRARTGSAAWSWSPGRRPALRADCGGMAAVTFTGRSLSTIRRCAGPPAGGSCRGRSSIPHYRLRERPARSWSARPVRSPPAPSAAEEAAGIARFGHLAPATLPRSRSSRPD